MFCTCFVDLCHDIFLELYVHSKRRASGHFSLVSMQYLHGNPLNCVIEWDAQNFVFNGWSQFWNSTFSKLLNWVFDFNNLMPLIGNHDDP